MQWMPHKPTMGATIAPDKSHVFATTKATREWLKIHEWPTIGKTIQVLQQFKYLGGQIYATERMQTRVLRKRLARATAVAHRLAYLNISVEQKLEVIEAKVLAMALYGTELANPPE